MNKNWRKFAAATLAATMVLGCSMTAFASEVGSEGTGTYEGGELQYPTLSVTLPTIPEGTYDYIADPNDLITTTSNAKYSGCTFSGGTGVYFLTSANTYTEKSAALSVTNENAQDIDVTVKLEQVTAGDTSIEYANTATFETADTANKLYLALTDGAATDPQVSALSSTAAATLTTTVTGVPGNYEASYTADGGYGYKLKDGATGWQSCSFVMTGAVNKNAEWGDSVVFPTIKVTWSYAEHQDEAAPSIAVTEVELAKGQDTKITVNLGAGDLAATGISKITYVNSSGSTRDLATTNYKLEGNVLTVYATYTDALTADRELTIVFSDTAATTETVTLKVAQ